MSNKLFIIIISIMSTILVYFSIMIGLILFNHKDFKSIPCEFVYYKPPTSIPSISNEEVDKIVQNHFNLFHFKIEDDNLVEKGMYGFTRITFRTVHIDKNINCWLRLYTYVHELCHLKYLTGNETYTTYMTFIELGKSDNIYMNYVYNLTIYYQCSLRAYENSDYDIAYYINKDLGRI